jgi:uncharacterized membrane protein YGL010W
MVLLLRDPNEAIGVRGALQSQRMAAFDWVRRMGVHEAYHLHRANRVLHWVNIPIELMMVVKLLSFGRIAAFDLGPLGTLAAGAIMIAMLLALRWLVLPLTTGFAVVDAVIALTIFGAAFIFQTRIGHGVFEEGVDDTSSNIAELRRTKNPVPILLVFYYHLVELLFAIGYRPVLRATMERHREEELARIHDDPRRRTLTRSRASWRSRRGRRRSALQR